MEQSKWQPIETAPKDGTYVLGYDKHNDEWYAMYFRPGVLNDWGVDGVRGYEWEYDVTPTHWMPLPTPPVDA